jgi:hypothetical protein
MKKHQQRTKNLQLSILRNFIVIVDTLENNYLKK